MAHSRSFLASQKARNAIVEAENLLIIINLSYKLAVNPAAEMYLFDKAIFLVEVVKVIILLLSEKVNSLLRTDNAEVKNIRSTTQTILNFKHVVECDVSREIRL